MKALAKYRQMRNFERTQEPAGQGARGKKVPRAAPDLKFVVQEHAARHLHYDFRLELDGVLLSWAVPKGPSLDPKVKRLAVEVEPHPLEYGDFEGTIPKGEYGAGTVVVWDKGTWTPQGDARQGLAKGHLSFSLQGKRLKGAWHLVRTHGWQGAGGKKQDGKSWLLFKSRDDAQKDAHPSHEGGHDRKPAAARASADDDLPKTFAPELATLVDAAPEGDAWLHEIKLDGYRILARVDEGEVTLFTRSGKDWTERMPSLRDALTRLPGKALLDGELVALNDQGVSDFQSLQNSLRDGGEASLVYFAFDLLHLDGRDLTSKPLVERKSQLQQLLEHHRAALGERVRLSAHVRGNGPEFFAQACKLGLEGIIAKRAASPYAGGRGRDWLKIKCGQRQEMTIVGYTDPSGSRNHFGALLLGAKKQGKLRYAGRVGTGFSEASLKELAERLRPLASREPAVVNPPKGADARGVHWVKPRLVAEVRFTEVTSEGLLRHPSFQGLRDDKPAREVKMETAKHVEATKHVKTAKHVKAVKHVETAELETAELETAEHVETTKHREAANHVEATSAAYPLTNPTKVLYPEQGITKQELLEYYAVVAERMLPHVANRPLTLVRCPNGRGKPCFFQKHPGKGSLPGLRSIAIREKDGKAPYSVLDDKLGLFGLVQLGALEIHTWGSRADDFEHPDLLVFDLDPDPTVDYASVIEGALTLRKIFEQAKLESFVKTTGGKGLHVCVPIAPDLDWTHIKDFTRRISEALAADAPTLYVATASKAKRRGKTFIDYLRNARGATFIAPYSTRARENAPIATPLEWDELSPSLPPHHFTVRNVAERLAKLKSDPFARLTQVTQQLRPTAE